MDPNRFKLIFLFVFSYCNVNCNCMSSTTIFPFKIDVQLDDNSQINVNWLVNYDEETVKFAVEINVLNYEWLAIGLSNHGDYENSDLCVLRQNRLIDSWIDDKGVIETDQQQDCLLETFQELPDGRRMVVYSRRFNTEDNKDLVIEEGTTQFIVAYGRTPRRNIFGHFVKKKIVPNRIFKSTKPPPSLPQDAKTLEVRANNVTIPEQETTYWCSVHRLPKDFTRKHHILKFEAVISPQSRGIVHHMEVFHCERPAGLRGMPMYNGLCVAENLPEPIKSCRRVIGAWAMGAEPFYYPEEAGIPIGGGGYYPYVMIEIHYNNAERLPNVVDNSGMAFVYTSTLRLFDAGVLEVGLEYTDRMAIPPKLNDFPLTGYCMPECTERGIPSTGITLFASQLHSHLTGRKLQTVHVRENRQLAVVNRDNHYSPHWQEIRHIEPVHVLPGDLLVTTCHYNTLQRKNITLGGLAITDEMCVNYIHYYPKANLEVCKSAVDPEALKPFFKYMKKLEEQPTDENNKVGENYKAIKWNDRRVEELAKFYQVAPIAAECRKNNGDLFPVAPKTVSTMR